MGEHKILNASKGPNYKKDQGIVRKIRTYSNQNIPCGKLFKMIKDIKRAEVLRDIKYWTTPVDNRCNRIKGQEIDWAYYDECEQFNWDKTTVQRLQSISDKGKKRVYKI